MNCTEGLLPACSLHGKPSQRETCRECNAAYMRAYLRQRRAQFPAWSLWERARQRAKTKLLPFDLKKAAIRLPRTCPVLGITLRFTGRRSIRSPSLDRVVPARGYVGGNVRVISDRANRIKSDRSLEDLRLLAGRGPIALRAEYQMIVTYLERELLLHEVREKSLQPGKAGQEWAKIAAFLDRLFSKSILN